MSTSADDSLLTRRTLLSRLRNLDDHLISRLLWGLVAKPDITDDDSRRMIMKKLAAEKELEEINTLIKSQDDKFFKNFSEAKERITRLKSLLK